MVARVNHNPVRAYRNAVGSHTTLRFMDDFWVQRSANPKTLKALGELERNVSLVCECPRNGSPPLARTGTLNTLLVYASSSHWEREFLHFRDSRVSHAELSP